MNTCKTCRFYEAQHHRCHARFVDVVTNKCEFKTDSMRVSLGNAGGGVDTNEWWVHDVFTGPDFACVHHKTIAHAGTKCQRCGGKVGCICVSRGSIPRMEAAGIPWSEIEGRIVPGFCSVCESLAYANAIEAQALTPQPPIANNADGESER